MLNYEEIGSKTFGSFMLPKRTPGNLMAPRKSDVSKIGMFKKRGGKLMLLTVARLWVKSHVPISKMIAAYEGFKVTTTSAMANNLG
jgi:hypothetical protein